MKKSLLISPLFFITLFVKSQPHADPDVSAELCPERNILIQFNFGSSDPSYFHIQSTTLKGCTIISNIDPSGKAVIKFSDKREVHEFKIYNTGIGQVVGTYTYTKIQSIDGLKPTWPPGTAGVFPTGDYDDVITSSNNPILPCVNSTTFQYVCPIFKNKDASGNEFGLELQFSEWLAPKGWKINGTVSDGVNPISSTGRAASVTPDPITTGEIKYRVKNTCDLVNLKKSNYYRIKIDRPVLSLVEGGTQNSIPIQCGEVTSKTFSLQNYAAFASCLQSTYTWTLGAVPNGWKYLGIDAPSTITTSSPNLTLEYNGNVTAPSNVSVQLTHNNGSHYSYTIPVIFTACTQSTLNLFPAIFPATCGVSGNQTFVINEGNVSPSITSYEWNLGPIPNGWKYQGNSVTTVTTTDRILDLTYDASLSGPPNSITVQPYFNNIIYPYSYAATPNFIQCCSFPPDNLSATVTGNGTASLNWSPAPGGISYDVEYVISSMGITGISTTTNNNCIFYGQAGINSQFRVRGTCSNGLTSAWSSWFPFFTSPPSSCNLQPATNLTASNSCGGSYMCGYIYYSWGAVSGANLYEIDYVVFKASTGQSYTGTTTSPSNTIYYMSYPSGISGPGWAVRFRVRSRCSTNVWSSFGNWSSNYSL